MIANSKLKAARPRRREMSLSKTLCALLGTGSI